jgi:lipid-A-disaccharide synthase
MKLFFIAGEASGDVHAAKIIQQLQLLHPSVSIVGWGGDEMQKCNIRFLSHYKNRNIMGFVEVIKKIRTINGYIQQAKSDIHTEKPDKIIFIDNPGFNLPLAKFAKKLGIEVHWYIAPKAWAWNKSRVKTMRQCIDHLYVIFPFEVDFFKKLGMPSKYVGNPTAEAVQLFLSENPEPLSKHKTIAILAGSRPNEVLKLLPKFILAAQKIASENDEIIVAAAPGLTKEFYQKILDEYNLKATILFGQTFQILYTASVTNGYALVASGTATLETALFNVPQVVAYEVNSITYFIAKNILKVKYVSLVNILLNEPCLEEILVDVTPEKLILAINRLEQDAENIKIKYQHLHAILDAKIKPSIHVSSSILP